MREVRCFGPPGTGKTTWLASSIKDTVRARGSDQVIVGSFTRTAAAEISGRDLPIPPRQIGTLHALAYRSIDQPELHAEHVPHWNARHPDLHLSGDYKASPEDDAPLEAPSGGAQGDRLMRSVEILRARVIPVDRWPTLERYFFEAWTAWKTAEGVIDFSDMIDIALRETTCAPGEPAVGYFDECQPPGTMIRTSEGDVRLDRIAIGDRVVSYSQSAVRLNRRGNRVVGITRRPYSGRLVNVRVAERVSSYTPNHLCLVRTADAFVGRHVLYLMGQGGRYRVGVTNFKNGVTQKTAGITSRLRDEGGDTLWVLDTFEDKGDALIAERSIVVDYGIPDVVFKESTGGSPTRHFVQSRLDAFWSQRSGMDSQAAAVLAVHGRDMRYPFMCRGEAVQMHRVSTVRAANLLVGMRVLDVDRYIGQGQNLEAWVPIEEVAITGYDGDVISLDVEINHTYVADGFVTHNCQDLTALELQLVRHWGRAMETLIVAGDDDQCIFSFRGATSEAFLNPPVPDADKRVLQQSWRVPAAVHAFVEPWIKQVARREPKIYLPRDADGTLTFDDNLSLSRPDSVVDAVVKRIDGGKTVMLLTSCSYLLEPLIAELRRRGVPFHNPLRRSRGDWNPLGSQSRTSSAQRLVAYLIIDERLFGERSRLWTGRDVAAWAQCLRTDGVFVRGVKNQLADLPHRELTYSEVENLFASPEQLEAAVEPSLEWFEANLLASKAKALRFPLTVAAKRSPLELLEEPRVVVGTIHSVKGGEAECVFVFPDLSLAGMREWERVGPPRDAVVRQFYVAFTRASEELVICEASSDQAIEEAAFKQFRSGG